MTNPDWYVAYTLDEESLLATINHIWEDGTQNPMQFGAGNWIKAYDDTVDELGAYVKFVKWFEESHPFYTLKYERS